MTMVILLLPVSMFSTGFFSAAVARSCTDQSVASALRNDLISYVFTAQTANTGEYSLVADREPMKV